MSTVEFLAKKNQDESFSISIKAVELVKYTFVDFYNDVTGEGYQRLEPQRARRGREVADYMERCVQQNLPPRLFELTANARDPIHVDFATLDEESNLGILTIDYDDEKWMSVIDGGTRLLGIETALSQFTIDDRLTFDVRLFVNLTQAEEIAQFLLINEKQKRVRTDLSLRVVQRRLDDDQLSEAEKSVLQTVVPEEDSWRFEASRIAGLMNSHVKSPWRGLIQMPNDKVTKPVKLQAFFSSLKTLLNEPDLNHEFEKIRKQQNKAEKSEVIAQILRNFWNAVKSTCPEAFDEPQTNVLWGSIGVNSCHIALAPILLSMLRNPSPDLSEAAFARMLEGTLVANYARWYTKPGVKAAEYYPGEKGDLPQKTGAANYSRLATILEKEWRASLHSETHSGTVIL